MTVAVKHPFHDVGASNAPPMTVWLGAMRNQRDRKVAPTADGGPRRRDEGT